MREGGECVWGGGGEREGEKEAGGGWGWFGGGCASEEQELKKKKPTNEIALEGLDEMRRLVKASPEALLD